MQNKISKIIVLVSVFLIISVFPNTVFGEGDWVGGAKGFIGAAAREEIDIDNQKLNNASSTMFNILTSVGIVTTVIVGIMLGIIFMVASANDKAKVKEALFPYLIGCIVIFGAFGIWRIVVNTFDGI